MNNIFSFLVTKEKRFFPNFIRQAELSERASQLLVELTKSPTQEERKEIAKQIKSCEREADEVQEFIDRDLYERFITPFDRDDIRMFTSTMDDYIDFINDAAKRIVMYRPRKIDQAIVDMAGCILESSRCFVELTRDLDKIEKKKHNINKCCERIKEIEHRADGHFENYMSYLFGSGLDDIEIIKCKSILQGVEYTANKAKEAADIMKAIIVKNS